ncbi:MAG: 4Fe-4S dicluster domain-containing protein [Candidatus Aenigmarchaeota archaeon]|nr:4Fe-4S dicluster domain-containing protein [Candidatus Aenigmarchaeota archaeon]
MGGPISSKYYLISKKDLQRLLDSLSKKMPLFAPVKHGKDFNFKRLESGDKLDIAGYTNTEYPPRGMFLPEGEAVLEYNKGKFSENFFKGKAAVFGIRPCDVHALLVLDRVMLGHDHFESHYKRRRENTLVFPLVCGTPGENCFCDSMLTRNLVESFDLLFTDIGHHYHVEPGSKAGLEIIAANKGLFQESVHKAAIVEVPCKKKLDTANLPGILAKARASGVWDEVAKQCVSCASCTFSCPTCYCFSLVHDSGIADPEHVKVIRELDYCMLLRYSRVAGGLVFREPRKERVQQFFYHKLAYGPENEGRFHCVGCGRCITECMAHIDITDVIGRIRDEHDKRK